MRGKKRPLTDRTRALGIALVEGVPAAAEQTGIPERTIRLWRDSEEYAELSQRTREAATDEMWAIVQKGFRRVEALLDEASDVQKTALATAIVADKMLLLRGEATSRTESRSLSDALDDHERATLKSIVTGLVADREAEGSDSGVGVDTGAAPVPT